MKHGGRQHMSRNAKAGSSRSWNPTIVAVRAVGPRAAAKVRQHPGQRITLGRQPLRQSAHAQPAAVLIELAQRQRSRCTRLHNVLMHAHTAIMELVSDG